MKEKQNKINRRNFLKTMGAAGLGAVFPPRHSTAEPDEPNAPAKTQETKLPQVPKRKLGKTGVEVSSLSLGASTLVDNQVILRNALQWGVSYWDTASSYTGGNSELCIGRFLAKKPDARKKLFLVTKASEAKTTAQIEQGLQTSLKRMNTSYIDLYYGIHDLRDITRLNDELRRWAESAKKRKLIRFFGFSIHKDVDLGLLAAAKLGWIDAIMAVYNFRLMDDSRTRDAIEACHKAGIGLIAMKTQARTRDKRADREAEEKLVGHFKYRGLTVGQAKIKALLEDERISSACVGMQSAALLTENVAAVLDKTKLSRTDRNVFAEYARATRSGYCAGCARICESPDAPCISDIMRYLMYYNSYGDKKEAKQLFARIPTDVRNKLLTIDYKTAQARCPQHIPIAKAVAEAFRKLT